MTNLVEWRLRETNEETREFLEELIDKIKDDYYQTLDLQFIGAFFEEFTADDLIHYTCGICTYRTDNCKCRGNYR